jgi:hypothetical protein
VTLLDRMDTDIPPTTVDAFPLIRSHTGMSAGIFRRFGSVVIGADVFRAAYDFDARVVTVPTGGTVTEDVDQTVTIVNAGLTLEW